MRLGTSDDLAQGPLPKVLAAFRNSHPDVELEITIGMTGKLYELMDAGTLDLMIGKRRDGERRGVPLFHGALEWLAVPGTVADLSRPLPLITVNEPSVTRAVVLDTLAKAGVQWRIVCSSSSHSGCVAATRRPVDGARATAGRGPRAAGQCRQPAGAAGSSSSRWRRGASAHPAETLLRLLQKSDLRGSRLDD